MRSKWSKSDVEVAEVRSHEEHDVKLGEERRTLEADRLKTKEEGGGRGKGGRA